MKISKLALIALLGGALMAFGCGSDSNEQAGSGGTGGGDGGGGGMGGEGGMGGGIAGMCEENIEDTCTSGTASDITENCDPALEAPPIADACDGTESTVNPADCTPTGADVLHRLTLVEVNSDCDAGYDLDSCNGMSCSQGILAQPEGVDGVDNQLAALAETLELAGGDIGNVNQAFYDAICAGDLDIMLRVDANIAESCAVVELISEGTALGTVNLNLAESEGNFCASGTLGDLPVSVGGATGTLNNAVVRVTISAGGFSNGVLGVTIPEMLAAEIADQVVEGGAAAVSQVLDIRTDLENDTSADCDALSMTLNIGGVAEVL